MKRLGLLFFTIALLGTSTIAQQSLSELSSEEYYDFWVGKWDVSWDEGEGKIGRGTNTIEKILDGKVIQENFRILEGQSAGFKGISHSVYQPQFELWKQSWADNNGGYYDFVGKFDGDKRMFQTTVFELEDGRKLTYRMIFYNIEENSLTWDWEVSYDAGENWNLMWRINYERKQ